MGRSSGRSSVASSGYPVQGYGVEEEAPLPPWLAEAQRTLENLSQYLGPQDSSRPPTVYEGTPSRRPSPEVSMRESTRAGGSTVLRTAGSTATLHETQKPGGGGGGGGRSGGYAVDSRGSPSRPVEGPAAPRVSSHSSQEQGSTAVALRQSRREAAPVSASASKRQAAPNLAMSSSSPDLSSLRRKVMNVLGDEGGEKDSLSRSRKVTLTPAGMRPSLKTLRDAPPAITPNVLSVRSDRDASDRADKFVSGVLDTCFDLEGLLGLTPSATRSPAKSGSLSARWNSQAASAAAAAAARATEAANQAAAAATLAASEASKAAAAAQAAAGRYDDVLEYVLGEEDGGLPALEDQAPLAGSIGNGRRKEQTLLRPRDPASLPEPGPPPQSREVEPAPGRSNGRAPAARDPRGERTQEVRVVSPPLAPPGATVGRPQDDEASSDGEEAAPDEETIARQASGEERALKLAEEVFDTTGVDLKKLITGQEWKALIPLLGQDADEGMDIFQRVEKEAKAKNPKGYPVLEFLEELKTDLKDSEGILHFARQLDIAKELVERGATSGKDGNKVAELTMFNKVAKALDIAGAQPSEAWAFIDAGKVPMSYAEQNILKTWRSKKEEFLKKCHEYDTVPPVVNATAGQTVCKQMCLEEVNAIIKRCKADGSKYTDPNFDMKGKPKDTLYVDTKDPGYDCTVCQPSGCKRLTTIVADSESGASKAMGGMFGSFAKPAGGKKVKKKPMLFKGCVKPGDIVQGAIGTCFLLGALGAIASHGDKLIERMILAHDVDVGVYAVRFCVHGEWTYVIVDDWFPVDEGGGLLYSRCKDAQEVWVPILEKAYCKLHTCFEMCDGGMPNEAIFSFFGGVGGRFQKKRKFEKNPKLYFKLLQEGKEKGWLMTTGFNPMIDGPMDQGKCGEPMAPNGLVGGHAYSVLKVVEHKGVQLVQCRNPWGSGEWKGKWSDDNNYGEWSEDFVKATGKVFEDDGKFWMAIEDFMKNTTGVDYARTFGPNWKKTTHYKQFVSSKMLVTATKNSSGRKKDELDLSTGDQVEVQGFLSNYWTGKCLRTGQEGAFPPGVVKVDDRPVARFDLVGTVDEPGKPMTVVVMVMQPNALMRRKFGKHPSGLNYKETDYPAIQLVVIGPDGGIAVKKEEKSRCVWSELELPGGGLWKIYAVCTDGKGAQYLLRVYMKGGTCTVTEIPDIKLEELTNAL